MSSVNEHTGDSIQTKAPSQSYRDNYDAIFRKKPEALIQPYISMSSPEQTDEEIAIAQSVSLMVDNLEPPKPELGFVCTASLLSRPVAS